MTTTSYYNSRELKQLKTIFEDAYQESDLVSVLEEVRGDLQLAIERITDGNINTWKVKAKKPVKATARQAPHPQAKEAETLHEEEEEASEGAEEGAVGPNLAKTSAPSAEPSGDGWDNTATVASTEDWGSTATKTTDGDWSAELERETSKMTITKKGFTVVKAVKNTNSTAVTAPAAPKVSNWASIVKGPEPAPEPTPPAVETAKAPQPAKKLVLVKKDITPTAPAPAPAQQAAPAVQEAWSPKQKSVQASPKLPTQPSPVLKAAIGSPPKHFDSPSAESTLAPSVSPSVTSSSQLPPGLGAQTRPQLTKKPKEGVVMPNGTAAAPSTTHVQFGSFGLAKAPAAGSEPANPKSPEKVEETAGASSFQFNPPQSTSTAAQNSRPTSASTEQTAHMGGAPGFYQQQPQFGLGNYSMYDNEQHRAMGYYVPESQGYNAKYGQEATGNNPSQSPATQHAHAAAAPNHIPQQNFQPYPYYPYYMNQYQQQAYQQPLYQQQHFGKYSGFQGPAPAASSKPAGQAPSQNSYGYGAPQQFYPNGSYEEDYGKTNGYAMQQGFFGGQKTDYKPQQNRAARPPYDNKASSGASSTNGAAASQAPTTQTSANPYYNGQQFAGMQYQQQFMMHPPGGYQGNPGYQGRGGPYWNGGN
ncbi:hypothetical protein HDV03_000695 [Kappamyces sp. JEL0829]|nr:hypothetical protein HDV03_000695 [Kappamyces sp. JEL0829]